MFHLPPLGEERGARRGQVTAPERSYFFGVGRTMLLARLVMISRAS